MVQLEARLSKGAVLNTVYCSVYLQPLVQFSMDQIWSVIGGILPNKCETCLDDKAKTEILYSQV